MDVLDLALKGANAGLGLGAIIAIIGAFRGWWVTKREFDAAVARCVALEADLKVERKRNDELREMGWTLARTAEKTASLASQKSP